MANRLKSLDLLRGVTIIFMIQFHIFKFWIRNNIGAIQDIIFFLGIIAAPFFLLISGISYHFFIENRLQDNFSKKEIFIDILKRALFVFSISTLIKFLFGHLLNLKFTFLYWSIFQMIAVSMILFSFILIIIKWRIPFFISFILFIFILNHLIIINNLYNLEILTKGSFPFIPWVNLFLFGMIIGSIFKIFTEKKNNLKIGFLLAAALVLIFLYVIWISKISYLRLNLFFFSLGLFLILFSGCYYFFDIKNFESIANRILIRWGKLSFSIYYLHFLIITIGLIIFTALFSIIFTLYHFLILLLILLISIEIFLRIWEIFDYFMSIEWLLNKISKKSLFSRDIS